MKTVQNELKTAQSELKKEDEILNLKQKFSGVKSGGRRKSKQFEYDFEKQEQNPETLGSFRRGKGVMEEASCDRINHKAFQ